jgi:hypothetical protein
MDTPRFTPSPAAKPPGGNSASAQAHGGRAAEKSATILPLHRGARVLQTTIERRYAEQGKRFADEQIADLGRESFGSRPPLFERIADALGSRDFFIFYCGIYAGCILTVTLALVWRVGQ